MNSLVRVRFWLLLFAVGAARAAGPVDFSAQIRPIISTKCFRCHGPDESSRKAGLRLDLREAALREHKGRRALVPGDLAASEIVRRIESADPEEQMPPAEAKNPLQPAEIALLRRWIAEGGKYSPHWAWIPPQRPARPPVRDARWPRNGIDWFILQALEAAGRQPSPAADPYTLARRVSLDLTGLPATPAEVDALVRDHRPDAYERFVDRLLDSPHFGERWARMWLDLARYADSAGYGSDPLRPNIWPYRDWVVRAFNRNLPYDRFTLEQIAGDLLPDATEDTRVATGFHRNTMTNTEGGTDDEEWRVAAVKDRANVTGQVWMGLTVGCAQCHTHKYDPITQREYYSFYAFFNQTEDNDQPDERPTMPVLSDTERSRRARFQLELARLDETLHAANPAFEAELARWAEAAARPVPWTTLTPVEASAAEGTVLTAAPDGSLRAGGPDPEKDAYTITYRTALKGVTALRLEALPDDSLPGHGPGRRPGEGNFVLQEIQATVRPVTPTPRTARFVRIEAPGPGRHLMLAEVEVMAGGRNVARPGRATQSSTDYEGAPERAIDGITDGHFFNAKSTSHTGKQDDPWWEVDLGADQAVDEIAVWNRTDGGGENLANVRVRLLDAARQPVWETRLAEAPKPSVRVGPSAGRTLPLGNATADHAQTDFAAANAVDGKPDSGWAVGGRLGTTNSLAVQLTEPVTEEGEILLTLTLRQRYGGHQTLGRFRWSETRQPGPVRLFPVKVQAALTAPAGARSPAERAELADFFRPESTSLGPIHRSWAGLRDQRDAIRGTALPVLREFPADQRRTTHLLGKGNYLTPGEEVGPGVPAAFHPLPDGAPTNRLGLARWLTAPANPLTARVAVNRFWAQLMGQGIVETEEDFGTQGTLPTHRELLDWLAVSFQSPRPDAGTPPSGPTTDPTLAWDVKALLRLIVTSATYRQGSRVSPGLLDQDPRNRLYTRAPRRRLDAEAIRDQALAISGLLSHRLGGPSVYPIQPDGLWRAAFNGERTWSTSEGENRYRRGIYTFLRRTVPYPSLATFDAPSRESCTLRRLPTNTPLQAFVTLNDPVFVEAAQALGRRIAAEGGASVPDRIRYGIRLATGRPATPAQVTALTALYQQELAGFNGREEDARRLATLPLGPLPAALGPAQAAAWTAVANVLLNLDAVLTRG